MAGRETDPLADVRLPSFLDGLPDPAMVVDPDMRALAANAVMAERIGLPLEQIVGQTLEELLPPDVAERRMRVARQVLESGRPLTFEDVRAGRHFINTAVPLRSSSGEVTAVAGIAIDITARRKAEAQLRRILTTSLEGVWEIDAESRTTFVNEQMAHMLGHTADEMMGRSMYDFMDAEARAIASRNVQRRQRGIAERHEFRFKHADGSDVWMILAASPYTDDEGRYAGAVALATDVTERRALERKVQDAQKLESLALLAGGVAHDFNNLLVGILGNASLATRTLPADSPARQHIDEIVTAGKRAAELTEQMLAYSGRARVEAEHIDLEALVAEMSRLLRTALPKEARLELRASDSPLVVVGDPTQLRQVVMNLITNAGEALEDGPGTITVRTGVEHATAERLAELRGSVTAEPGPYAWVEVSDTGRGMDPRTRARIFDPFFTTKFTGRGLGLAAVLGILRAHGGGIEVHSEPGRGTTFRVLLPLADNASEADPPPAHAAEEQWRGNGVALLVDDEAHVRSVLSSTLELLGFQPVVCESGEGALRVLEERRELVRVAIVDVTMPGLDGTDVLRAIRDSGNPVPVVLASGKPQPELDDAALGPYVFLPKPFGIAEVRSALREALGE